MPGQSVLAVGVQPGAGVHRLGFRGQVESNDAAGVQVGQQCGAGNRFRRAEQAETVPDHRGHDRRGHPGGLFEDAPLGLQGLIDVGVAGVDRGLLIAADHQHRRPHHNQRPQRIDFGGGEWPHRVEGLDRGQHRRRFAALVTQHRGDRDRQFGHRPGSGEVAEVDDAVGQAALEQAAIERRRAHDVVVGDVAVDHLDRQVRCHCGDGVPGGHGGRGHGVAAGRVGDVLGQCPDGPDAVAQVPLQHPVDAGMVEPGQCPADAAGQGAESGHPGGAQMMFAAEGSAGQVVDDAGQQWGRGAGVDDLRPAGRADVDGGADAFARRDEGRRRVLGLEFDATERRVGDLEHADRRPGGIAE